MLVPASKNTLKSLSQNIKDTMEEVQCLMPTLVELKKRAAQNAGPNGTISSLVAHIQDLSLGSHFIVSEMMSLFRSLIDTDNVYEKRFYMKWLNQSFFESYVYFSKKDDGKDVDGVWLQIKPEISTLQNPVLDSYLKLIDKALDDIRQSHFDRELRNATAHFNAPQDEYKNLLMYKDEDNIAKGVSSFMYLHMRMSQLCTILTAILLQIIPKQDTITSESKTDNNNHFCTLLNDKLSEAFNRNDKLNLALNETIAQSAKELDDDNKCLNTVYKAKDFASSHGIEFKQYDVMHQLVLIRMTVAFMKGDLACSVKSYLHSEDNMERASNLRRINLVETAIFTRLYGYNEIKQTSSLWAKLRKFDGSFSDDETRNIESKLKEITKELDNYNRNLNTHYREGEKLNIVERYELYSNQHHADAMVHCLELVKLCKDMDVYTMHVLDRYKRNLAIESEKERKDRHDMFEKICNLVCNSKSSDEIKQQFKKMMDQSERQINDLFNK